MKHFVTTICAILTMAAAAHAQQDSVSTHCNDSILQEITTLKGFEIKAPRPIYSMDAGVVNYNVANDETIKGGTALDALRNAPSVDVDVDGNVTLRGSSKVEIWINGYPTHMNGESMRIYLTSLSTETIDHIEVVKNPSAEYIVGDNTGIINIVMSSKLRLSQFVAVGLSGNSRPYVSPWASYVFEGDKLDFNIYLAPSISNHRTSTNGASWSFKDNAAGGLDTTQSQSWRTTDTSHNYYSTLNIGLNYKFDSMNDLSFNSFSLFQGFDTRSTDNRYRTEYEPNRLPLHYVTDKEENRINANGFSTLTYRHKFDNRGHNISLTVNTNWQYYLNDNQTNRLFDGYCPNELWKSSLHRSSLSPSFSARYRKPIGENDNLSVGIGFTPNRNHFLSSSLYFDSTSMAYSQSDTLRDRETTTRTQEEFVSLNWRHQTNTFSTTLGVVAEARQTDYSVQSIFPEDLRLNYVSLRPTFNFTCHTKSMHYFSFDYTLSSGNPSPSQLSQSPNYQYDSYSVGNPLLEPYIEHKADISWNKYFKSGSSTSVEAYGEWNSNTIESVLDATTSPDPYLGRVVPFTTYYNIGRSYKYGLESNVTYRVNAFLRFGLYCNLYYSTYEIDHPKTGLFSDSAITYSLRLNCNAKLFKKVYLNVSGNYTSPTLDPFAEHRSNYNINLSAEANFLKDRLSARISISDLFNWNQTDNLNTNPYYITTKSSHRDSRYITFGLTYRIGKMSLKHRARSGAGME